MVGRTGTTRTRTVRGRPTDFPRVRVGIASRAHPGSQQIVAANPLSWIRSSQASNLNPSPAASRSVGAGDRETVARQRRVSWHSKILSILRTHQSSLPSPASNVETTCIAFVVSRRPTERSSYFSARAEIHKRGSKARKAGWPDQRHLAYTPIP